jgi:hypothetical protein
MLPYDFLTLREHAVWSQFVNGASGKEVGRMLFASSTALLALWRTIGAQSTQQGRRLNMADDGFRLGTCY